MGASTPQTAASGSTPLLPRRSPRNHSHSLHLSRRDDTGIGDVGGIQKSLFKDPTRSSQRHSETSESDEELDRQALSLPTTNKDKFPPPPVALPIPTDQIVRPPLAFGARTRPLPSTCEDSTLPPSSTIQGSTQPRTSVIEGTTQESVELIDLVDKSNEQAAAELDRQNEFRRLYVHLHRITVYEQKALASSFKVIQQGNEKVRANRLFVTITGIMERTSRSVLAFLQEKGSEKWKDFKTEYLRTITTWTAKDDANVVPPISQLEAEVGIRQHPRARQVDATIDDKSDDEEQVTAADHASSGFSPEEFARLMIIFRDVPEAATDLRQSGQDLSRENLGTGRTRNSFWTDRIEKIFNDPSYITNQPLDAPLQNVDPGRPVTVFRDGSSLQELFTKFRKEFTQIYSRWNVSGNMEHETFINFCRLPSMKTLSRSGPRCFIAFRIFGFGTARQNTLLLDFCSKHMADSSGARLESGLGANGESGVRSEKTKKRLSDDEINETIGNVVQQLSKEDEGPSTKKPRTDFEDVQLLRAQREDDSHLMKELLETHDRQIKMNQQVEDDIPLLVDCFYKRLAKQARDRMKNELEQLQSA